MDSMGKSGVVIRKLTGFRLGQFGMYPARPLALPARYHVSEPLTDAPSISIVTPVFNQAAYVAATIESVLSQEYPALQYVVMDGGSTDGTVEIINRYRSRLDYFHSGRDSGQAHAINSGMQQCTGDILAWLNGDDLLLAGSLAHVASVFRNQPDVDVVYGHRLIIDEYGNDIGRWLLPAHDPQVLSWVDYVPQETLFWRRSLWERIGAGVDESYQFALDWDMLLRMRDANAKFLRLPRLLGAFRVHAAQKTQAEMAQVGVAEMHRLRQRVLGRQPSRAEIRLRVAPYIARHIAYQWFSQDAW